MAVVTPDQAIEALNNTIFNTPFSDGKEAVAYLGKRWFWACLKKIQQSDDVTEPKTGDHFYYKSVKVICA